MEITINEIIKTYGLISFNIENVNGMLEGRGILKTHLYIDEIDTLECDRFKLEGIDVYRESFGSTDPFIIYEFTFQAFDTFYEDFDYEEEELIEMYERGEE